MKKKAQIIIEGKNNRNQENNNKGYKQFLSRFLYPDEKKMSKIRTNERIEEC